MIYLHIGLPKTGTTTIQNLLMSAFPLRYAGKGLISQSAFNYNDQAAEFFCDYLSGKSKYPVDISKFDEQIISNESILHPFGPSLEKLISRLNSLNTPLNLLITIREQGNWLASWKNAQVGNSFKAESLLGARKHLLEILNYNEVVDRLKKSPNVNSVQVLPLESFATEKEKVLRILSSWVNESIDPEYSFFLETNYNNAIENGKMLTFKSRISNRCRTFLVVPLFFKIWHLRHLRRSNQNLGRVSPFEFRFLGYIN